MQRIGIDDPHGNTPPSHRPFCRAAEPQAKLKRAKIIVDNTKARESGNNRIATKPAKITKSQRHADLLTDLPTAHRAKLKRGKSTWIATKPAKREKSG